MNWIETIIIGAGPAGLACARHLAENGKEVLVLERNNHVGPKVCAGGITAHGGLTDLPDHLIEKSFRSQIIRSGMQSVTITSREPIVSTVSRANLGHWMLEKAHEAGAAIMTGVHVTSVKENTIETSTGAFTCRYLVGADGSSSLVRRHLGIKTERLMAGIHFEVPGNFDSMEWHLDYQHFRSGYGWKFPHRTYASIGACAPLHILPAKKLARNIHLWAERNRIALNKLNAKASLINYDYRGWRFGNKFLVGEAAGLASGVTGEGIYPAMVSGTSAAQMIIDPSSEPAGMQKIIRKHKLHSVLQQVSGTNKYLCKMIIEILILGLRAGLINFNTLEMA